MKISHRSRYLGALLISIFALACSEAPKVEPKLGPANRGQMSVRPSRQMSFGTTTVGKAKIQYATLKNEGTVTINSLKGTKLLSPFSYAGGTFPGRTGTCKGTIEPQGECSIAIEFAPRTEGLTTVNWQVMSQDALGFKKVETRILTGRGQYEVAVRPKHIDELQLTLVEFSPDPFFAEKSAVRTASPLDPRVERQIELRFEYLIIEVHTDALGDQDINQKLTKDQAEALKMELVQKYSVESSSIEAVGVGEGAPIQGSLSEEARAKNRRIRFKFYR